MPFLILQKKVGTGKFLTRNAIEENGSLTRPVVAVMDNTISLALEENGSLTRPVVAVMDNTISLALEENGSLTRPPAP